MYMENILNNCFENMKMSEAVKSYGCSTFSRMIANDDGYVLLLCPQPVLFTLNVRSVLPKSVIIVTSFFSLDIYTCNTSNTYRTY